MKRKIKDIKINKEELMNDIEFILIDVCLPILISIIYLYIKNKW